MSDPRDPRAGHDGALDYHRRMLADPHRIATYERALRRLIRPGDVVLDLGSGTGVLSMLAARRGARVHAVESMPIAIAARRVIADNGLSDRVVVHQADIRALEPVEPVDLIVSDFLGRFLTDDLMLDALAAALRWLKPGGRVCPSKVTLRVAPVAFGHFAPLDTFEAPIAGLDFSSLGETARSWTYPAEVDPGALLAPATPYHTLHTRLLDPSSPFDTALSFEISRPGRLRGLAGWFEALMAPGVSLSTEPGVETHWGQLLFPLPAQEVTPGDRLSLRLRLEGDLWRWEGALEPRAGAPRPFSLSSVGRLEAGSPQRRPPLSTEAIEALNAAGAAAIGSGDHAAAVGAFERATSGLGPQHDYLAAPLFENLGVAYTLAGRWIPAIGAFLRALDGDLTSREQSARLLVSACHSGGRPRDAARYRAAYEAHFGPL